MYQCNKCGHPTGATDNCCSNCNHAQNTIGEGTCENCSSIVIETVCDGTLNIENAFSVINDATIVPDNTVKE